MSYIYRILAVLVFTFSWQHTLQADARTEELPGVKIELEKFFAQVYTKTCIRNAEDMSALKDQFAKGKVTKLKKKNAKLFLEDKVGTVWIVPHQVGDFLVSIDENNVCTAYTHNVNINKVEQHFTQILERSVKTGFNVERIQDETLQTDVGPTHYISYIRTNKKNYFKQKFQLITTSAQGALIQAKVIVEPIKEK